MISIEDLKARKGLPLMHDMTSCLQSSSAKYGYTHVQSNGRGRYYCVYKTINTGLHETPMLAAYNLLRLAKKSKVEVLNRIDVEYYPEYFIKTVDETAMEYLREPNVKAGWKGVKIRVNKGVRSFSCDIVLDGHAYRSKSYATPAEAAWEVHCGKAKRAVVYEQKPDTKGLVSLADIVYLQDGGTYPDGEISYKCVRPSGNGFKGSFAIHGVYYYTEWYALAEQAAWAIHHHLLDAPEIDSIAKSADARRMPENAADMRARISREYAEARANLVEVKT